MTEPVASADDPRASGSGRSPEDVEVERALAVPTRAGIYRRLRTEGQPVSAREVATMFGLHANVARTHLDVLAEAGLVVTGQRKQAAGGRPAKVYVAREQAVHGPGGKEAAVPPGGQLAVHTIVQLIAGLAEHREKLAILAEEQGRKLVSAAAGRADARDFEAAAVVAVEALRRAFPEVRLTEVEGDAATVEGLGVGLKLVGEVDGQVGDALAAGFLRGALAAAGAPARVEARDGNVQAVLDEAGLGAQPSAIARVDARAQSYEQGIVAAMRAIVPLRAGDHLEVLTDGQGAPAAYARWADRAGHQVVDVTRIRDLKGARAVRILLRKATGR
ncbi:MAG: helix-turn-helix domain-containing protein [Nitriliruptoraceae bacterium]|nr:helix-turn-helix domain-containing protein [Nitriliruptoraceae bacterium]